MALPVGSLHLSSTTFTRWSWSRVVWEMIWPVSTGGWWEYMWALETWAMRDWCTSMWTLTSSYITMTGVPTVEQTGWSATHLAPTTGWWRVRTWRRGAWWVSVWWPVVRVSSGAVCWTLIISLVHWHCSVSSSADPLLQSAPVCSSLLQWWISLSTLFNSWSEFAILTKFDWSDRAGLALSGSVITLQASALLLVFD